jgi:hypothetical protein
LVIVAPIKERTGSDEVPGQDDFLPSFGKNTDRPIADQVRKHLRSEGLISARDDLRVRIRNTKTDTRATKITAVIETTVPHDPVPIRQAIRLL